MNYRAIVSENEKKQRVLNNPNLTDMEKLRDIFTISQESLREHDVFLYYAILAVLDKEKKPDASEYFSA